MRSCGETRCMIPQKPKNKTKIRESKEVQRDISHDLPGWLQEVRENLVDESSSEERRGDLMQRSADTSSSSHDPPTEPPASMRGTGFG